MKINFSAVPNETYAQAHASRLTAGSIDVGLAGPKELPSYVPASNEGDDARLADQGGYVDLTDQAFMKKYNPTVLDQIKYKGKNYTVPTGLSYYSGMFYNKKIFADNGIKVPTTWSELIAACDALKAKGIVPLGIGGKDSAGLNMLGVAQSLYPTAQVKEDLAKGLYDGSVKLNVDTQLKVLQQVQKLYSYAEPNFAGVSYATMTSDFVNGKFAMMSDGTWNTTTIQQAGGSKLDFGYFPLPASDNAADNKFLGRQGRADPGHPEQRQEQVSRDRVPVVLHRQLPALRRPGRVRTVRDRRQEQPVLHRHRAVHQHLPAGLGHDLDPQHQGWPGGSEPVQLGGHRADGQVRRPRGR